MVSLQEAGYDVVALDNFTNSVIGTDNQSMALKRAEKITKKPITFYKCDLLNKDDIDDIFVKVSEMSCSRFELLIRNSLLDCCAAYLGDLQLATICFALTIHPLKINKIKF